ncbi:MAG TPA: sugar phosphate isomerase/epimerase [Firmicutes bacterium]|nr:sugar phosphate isomerase/epimerase [Bacillota bacterium]
MSRALFGLSTAHIAHDTIATAIDRCVELGTDAVEFFTAEYSVDECREIRDRARDASLLVDYHAPWHGDNDLGLSPRDTAFHSLEQSIARAQLMSARHLVCHLGRYDLDDPNGRERAIDQVIEITHALEDAVEDADLVLVYEDNTLVHDPNPLGDTPRDFERLFAAIDNPRIGMILDTGHAHVTGFTRTYLDQFGSRIRYVHLDDNGGIGDDHLPPSAGTIDWEQEFEWFAYYGIEPNFAIEFNESYVAAELPIFRDLAARYSWER